MRKENLRQTIIACVCGKLENEILLYNENNMNSTIFLCDGRVNEMRRIRPRWRWQTGEISAFRSDCGKRKLTLFAAESHFIKINNEIIDLNQLKDVFIKFFFSYLVVRFALNPKMPLYDMEFGAHSDIHSYTDSQSHRSPNEQHRTTINAQLIYSVFFHRPHLLSEYWAVVGPTTNV